MPQAPSNPWQTKVTAIRAGTSAYRAYSRAHEISAQGQNGDSRLAIRLDWTGIRARLTRCFAATRRDGIPRSTNGPALSCAQLAAFIAAINIRADNASASEVERLWDQVAAFEDEPSMRALGYRPHFTFAIYDSPEIEERTTWEATLRAVEGEAQLRIEFRRIRWFVGPQLVLWAEPAADETLIRWHVSISAAINPAHRRSHYRPGAWTPHCTLGTRITGAKSNDAWPLRGL